jgi:hypothetical protein
MTSNWIVAGISAGVSLIVTGIFNMWVGTQIKILNTVLGHSTAIADQGIALSLGFTILGLFLVAISYVRERASYTQNRTREGER